MKVGPLQLNSASPRRRELLAQIAAPFTLVSAEIDESVHAGESARDYVLRLAIAKAEAGWRRSPLAPCLGSDTTVVAYNEQGEQILGKPVDKDSALAMLALLSGKWHSVFTAVAIADGERCVSKLTESRVRMREISQAEMEAYWQTGEPAHKAGAYGIQGLAAVFIAELQGSYSAVMGLPLAETAVLMDEFKLPHGLSCVTGLR